MRQLILCTSLVLLDSCTGNAGHAPMDAGAQQQDAGGAATASRTIRPAGLVALAPGPEALIIGTHATVTSDQILSNGSVTLESHALVQSTLIAGGNLDLAPFGRLVGDVSIAGEASFQPGAEVVGTLTTHSVPAELLFPSTLELLRLQHGDYGNPAPDVVLAAHEFRSLAAGGARIGRMILGPQSVLRVSGESNLEVTGEVSLGAQARIVVGPSGRLHLHVAGLLDLGPGAGIIQEGTGANSLNLLLGAGAKVSLSPNTEFGPGLLYGPDTEIVASDAAAPSKGVSIFTGALVASKIVLRGHASVVASSRYLSCPFTSAQPALNLTHPVGPAETTVGPGVASVSVSGTTSTAEELDSATLQDGIRTVPLVLEPSGAFVANAQLRADGEPTSICVSVRGCGGQTARRCVLVSVQHAVDFVVASPAPGSMLNEPRINVTGRITRGQFQSIEANGIPGYALGDTFIIPAVPLTAGLNTLTVRAVPPTGASTSHRLLVSNGPMPVDRMEIQIGPDRATRILHRAPAPAAKVSFVSSGAMSYRLLDPNGVELFRTGIPGTMPESFHVVDADGGLHTYGPISPLNAFALVPRLATATRIEFLDGDVAVVPEGP